MVMIIGHRGGRNLWPENSLSGFRKLRAMPVEGVEFDVHLTNDGELLVIHDPTLDRTPGHSGPVAPSPRTLRSSVHMKRNTAERRVWRRAAEQRAYLRRRFIRR